MGSRMDKYYNTSSTSTYNKRSQKNEKLYKEVNKQTFEDFNVNSNVSVLGESKNKIDLEDLRQLLNQRYKTNNQRKKLEFDIKDDDISIEEDKTKEYDINAILEKAHQNQTVDYEKQRLKKIRDTQYDILKGLDLEHNQEEEEVSEEEKKLMTLIDTITANEINSQGNDPLDLFEDLKGDEDTQVIPAQKDSQQKPFDTDKLKNVVAKEVKNQIDNSFYTKSFNLSKNDFDEFKDLQEDVKSNSVLVTILIIIVIVAFLAGVFVFLNIYFNWGIL